MRKVVVALLVLAIVVFSACISNAGFVDGNPERYFKQSITNDGNILYLDKNSVRRYKDNITEYVGIVELNTSSDLFKKACELVPSTQEPLYVATAMRLDCINARFQGGKMMILGFEKADASVQIKPLWTQDSEEYSDWVPLKGRGIEPGAKAVLCSPSF
jgi:hypothetical protein